MRPAYRFLVPIAFVGAAAAVAAVVLRRDLPIDEGRRFSASGACAACHTGLVDEAGTDVSIDADWRATMLAQAARDPYWRASVRAEIVRHPALAGVIEDKCATCHAPMARATLAAEGRAARLLDGGLLDPADTLHVLAMDGVSCALCHQIRPEGIEGGAAHSGHFEVDTAAGRGDRVIYGPFAPDLDLEWVMREASGFRSVRSDHMRSAEFCAACHVLRTPFVDSTGAVVGEFPEQMAYHEWRASSFAPDTTCADCHMPLAEGGVALSNLGGPRRAPFRRHQFLGANAHMLRIFAAAADTLGAPTDPAAFADAAARTEAYLSSRAATVSIEGAAIEDGRLEATVVVRVLAGHKIPTGFPSRRAWIRFTVRDAAGRVVFRSGGVRPDGSIEGNANDDDPAAFEPHRATIRSADDVQIYEAILETHEGDVTTGLLRAARYRKDNRLLPPGFAKASADAEIAVRGAAEADEDFDGGGDRVRYDVPVGGATGPLTVTAEVLYQSIGRRWAENLRPYAAYPEVRLFLDLYDGIENDPAVLAAATAVVRGT